VFFYPNNFNSINDDIKNNTNFIYLLYIKNIYFLIEFLVVLFFSWTIMNNYQIVSLFTLGLVYYIIIGFMYHILKIDDDLDTYIYNKSVQTYKINILNKNYNKLNL
jgi:hypothetical protein